jgi:hypothetical protein
MMSAYRSVRNLGLLAMGMIMGCMLAYMAHKPYSLPFTTIIYLLPFLIAMLVGIAKTTTA